MAKVSYDPGQLRHRLELQSLTETPDGCGGLITSWNHIDHVWGQIKPNRQVRQLQGQQVTELSTNIIIIRYREDVASGWRLVYDGRIFEILTLADLNERTEYLECHAREGGR